MARIPLSSVLYTVFTSFVLSACADGPRISETGNPPAAQCSGQPSAFGQAPTPATQAAMDQFAASEKRDLQDLFTGVGNGDASSQIELGLRYANGTGVAQDAERAFRLFSAAAQQNNAVGMFYLGSAYANGLGVDSNDLQAVITWEEAARLGHPMSQYWLGFMIANGRGGIQSNWCAAIPLLEAAAARDHADAAFMLGVGYEEGKFSQPDFERAASWYRKAYKKEPNAKALFSLRSLIDRRLVKWQEGDPGKPMPPPEPKVHIKDKSAGDVG